MEANTGEAAFHSELRREMRELEAAQARPLREIALAVDEQARADALARLQALDDRIAELRQQLRTIT